jgi:hypothetical protein
VAFGHRFPCRCSFPDTAGRIPLELHSITKFFGESGEHRGYIENMKLNTATGYHFNTKGHTSDNQTLRIPVVVRPSILLRPPDSPKNLVIE